MSNSCKACCNLYRCDGAWIQLGTILDCFGPEQGDEIPKGQVHIMPSPCFSVKAPARRNRQFAASSG